MTLIEYLTETDVRVHQKVGFIFEAKNEAGKWIAQQTGVGRVLNEIPVEAENQEELQSYDPEYDLLVLCEERLTVLRTENDSRFFHLKPSGLMMIGTKFRIQIGQTELFIDSVYGIMCALKQ